MYLDSGCRKGRTIAWGDNEGRSGKWGKRIKEREENEGGGWKKEQKKWDEVNGVKNPRTTRVSCQWPCLQTTFVDLFFRLKSVELGNDRKHEHSAARWLRNSILYRRNSALTINCMKANIRIEEEKTVSRQSRVDLTMSSKLVSYSHHFCGMACNWQRSQSARCINVFHW